MLVGWDAADWKIIHKLMDEGLMPTVASMVENGVMGNMRTLFPALSPMLWTSIATGKRPYKHGIYGFTEPAPDGKSVQAMSNMSRKCKALWNILGQNDLRSLVVGWWPSHPAEPIKGCMVSDFYHKVPKRPDQPWKLMKHAIHPESMFSELEQLRIHPSHLSPEEVLPFVPFAPEIDQKVDSRLSTVMRMLCECTSIHGAATHLLENEEWDFSAIYYDAIDHFCHGYMRYHPPQQKGVSDEDFRMYSNVVSMGYQYHDMMLARLMELAGEDTTVILMSDHGFHPDHLRTQFIPTEPAGPAIEHRDYGIFIAQGPGIKKDAIVHGAGLMDVAPTILRMYDLPVGEDMDGRVLTEIFAEPPEEKFIDSWENVAGDDGRHPDDFEFDPVESKEALEQLIALGYVERPDDNYEVAIRKCTDELDYNLARSYMDEGRFGEAIPLLLNLYNDQPLEFRFGIQLSNCLNAMGRRTDLETLVNDLNSRWRLASEEAKKRISDVAAVAKQRRKQWKKLQELDKKNKEDGVENVARLAQVTPNGKPKLFSEIEGYEIRKIRSVARGNPQTLDFLNATIAISKGDFESALDLMEQAEFTKSRNPAFQYQLGNVYLGMDRVEDAERTFSKALEIDEYYPEALFGLCRAAIKNSKPKLAVDLGRQAVGLKYHFPLAHYFLAQAKTRNDDVEGAVESFKTAIEQNPNFSEAHEKLAELYRTKLNDEELAREHQAAVRDIELDREEYQEETVGLEIIESETVDYSDVLPKFELKDESGKNAEFVTCLGQRPIQTDENETDIQPADGKEIVVVAGLPRSGTSMMMQMLVAGGLVAHTDSRREADESNPKGYFESEDVKKLAQSNHWLDNCGGKVIKVVVPLIPYLSQRNQYRVILMNRDIKEIIASQEKMLERLDREGGNLAAEKFDQLFQAQMRHCRQLFMIHKIPYLEVKYSEAIENPAAICQQIREFMPQNISETMIDQNMIDAVDPKLYREKRNLS